MMPYHTFENVTCLGIFFTNELMGRVHLNPSPDEFKDEFMFSVVCVSFLKYDFFNQMEMGPPQPPPPPPAPIKHLSP